MIIRVFEARLRPGSEHDFMAGQRGLFAPPDIEGLLGASIGRRIAGGHTRVIVLTVWRDRDAIEVFAGVGAGMERPVYVPGTEELVEAWTITHYDAVDVPELAPAGDAGSAETAVAGGAPAG